MVGGILVLVLMTLSMFAEFFAPYPLNKYNSQISLTPPTQIHFVDQDGSFHLRPFIYKMSEKIDPATGQPAYDPVTFLTIFEMDEVGAGIIVILAIIVSSIYFWRVRARFE